MSLRFDVKLMLSVKGPPSKLGEEKLFMGLMTTPSLRHKENQTMHLNEFEMFIQKRQSFSIGNGNYER
jgi:hypothetical protein